MTLFELAWAGIAVLFVIAAPEIVDRRAEHSGLSLSVDRRAWAIRFIRGIGVVMGVFWWLGRGQAIL